MNNLVKEWDEAADKIEEDPMRLFRYAMAMRYFQELDRDVKILDVGCGEGSGLRFLQTSGFRNLFGVEVSNKRLERAQSRASGIKIFQIPPEQMSLPFEDSSFDVVLSMGVIEHAKDDRLFVNEIARVAKRNAKIIISSDGFGWRFLQILGLYRSVQPIDRTKSYYQFESLFRTNRLSVKHFETFEWIKRGNILFFYTCPRALKPLFYSSEVKEKEQMDGIIRRGIDYTNRFRLYQKLINWVADENIFLLQKD